MEKFHNSPPVDPVVSITTPEIKKRLGSWVRTSISVLVIGGMATAFAADDENIVSDNPGDTSPENIEELVAPAASAAQSLTDCDLTGVNMGWDKIHSSGGVNYHSTLVGDLKSRGISVSEINTGPITKELLENYDILWLNEWSRGNWSTSEIEAVKNWVNKGGYFVIHGDQVYNAKPLMKVFGYSMGSNSGGSRLVTNITEHYTTSDVSKIYMPNPIASITSGPDKIVIYDGKGNKGVAAHEYGSGKIVFIIADEFLSNWSINQADNRLFGNQVIDWFVCGGAVAGPGKFEFTSKIYFANESAGNAIVKVARKGGSNGVVSVNYATAAFEDRDTINPTKNPATEGEDYATTEGSLTWKDGESGIQTFKVPLFNDQDEEGDETVQLLLSSPTGAALGDQKTAKLRIADDECHGVYTTAARTLYHPLITVPVFDPISGQPTEDVRVFEGTFNLLNGTEDFIIDVTNQGQFNKVKDIKNINKLKADCYAKYDWQTETFQIPYVDVPSIVVLPMGHSQVGPTQIFRAKMQQMPLSGEYEIGNYIFHVEGAPFQDASITADPNASVHSESKDEVEAKVDASIEIAPDELTYYQYLYTYDK